jgi:hypothetical protein
MVWSLTLVATVLIYIYPLRVIFGAFFANASGDFLPVPFDLNVAQIGTLFVVFGVGFSILAGLMVVLYLIALKRRDSLLLNSGEIFQTRGDMIGWALVMLTGLTSTALALTLPDDLSPLSGFVYWTLWVTMPLFGMWFTKTAKSAGESE